MPAEVEAEPEPEARGWDLDFDLNMADPAAGGPNDTLPEVHAAKTLKTPREVSPSRPQQVLSVLGRVGNERPSQILYNTNIDLY